ncbi:MAG TPA: hypothetical protein VN643_07075 [Pyrinomonadaceae bacterium]|nr:hypothetical protein [Pyrinomonadaceae bacterium]
MSKPISQKIGIHNQVNGSMPNEIIDKTRDRLLAMPDRDAALNGSTTSQRQPRKKEDPLVTYSVTPRKLKMYVVMDQELRNLGSASSTASMYLTFLGIAMGALMTSAGTLSTVEIESDTIRTAFYAVLIVAIFSTIWFAILSWLAVKRHKDEIHAIQNEARAGTLESKAPMSDARH